MATAKKTAPKSTTRKTTTRKATTPKAAATKNTTTAAEPAARVSFGPFEVTNLDVKMLITDYAYATVGATDRALAVARELPQKLEELSKARAEKAETRLTEVRTKVQGLLKDAPTRLQGEVKETVETARKEYDSYTARGREVVKTVSDAEATKKALEQTETARSQIKGAVTSIRKAVEQGQDAVEDAAGRIGIRRNVA